VKQLKTNAEEEVGLCSLCTFAIVCVQHDRRLCPRTDHQLTFRRKGARPGCPATSGQRSADGAILARPHPPLPKPSSAKQWSDDEKRLRQRILRDVVYHGWPQEWVDSAPHFELMGTIETDKGYQIRKLRYQIVPGFLGTALLYEPENIHERMPAVLNLPATNLPASRWSMNRSASPVRITATESTEPLGT